MEEEEEKPIDEKFSNKETSKSLAREWEVMVELPAIYTGGRN